MMLQRFLNGLDCLKSRDNSGTTNSSATLPLENVDVQRANKMPRPTRSTPIHRIPHRSTKLDNKYFENLDLLKLFRHELIGTTKPVSSIFIQFNSERMIRIIDDYFRYLDNIFKEQPNISYLDLINYSKYPYDDWLAYGSRFEEFVIQSFRVFSAKKKQLFNEAIKNYLRIHPRGVIAVRKKLLDLLMKSLSTGNAHELDISYEMISYPLIDEW